MYWQAEREIVGPTGSRIEVSYVFGQRVRVQVWVRGEREVKER